MDAARRASLYNQTLSGLAVTERPEEFRMPERHGSLFGGVLMILAGLAILSRTLFGYSLQWLEHWWPMALVLLGACLVYQALGEQREIWRPEQDVGAHAEERVYRCARVCVPLHSSRPASPDSRTSLHSFSE